MARRLIADGYEVSVYNRTAARCEEFVGLGARSSNTPAEAAAASDLSIVAITDDAALLTMMVGSEGIQSGAKTGSVVVNCSTVSPETERANAASLREVGVGYVDAPVTGGAEAAKKGTLTLLCGGEMADFEKARPVLLSVGSKVIHLGPIGAGQLTKAVNQVILAGSLLGVAEGMMLARANGLDLEKLIEALREGAGASWVLSNRAIFMAREDFPPVGRLALHMKDLNIALATAKGANVELAGATLVRDLEQKLAASGRGDFDISALILALQPGFGRT